MSYRQYFNIDPEYFPQVDKKVIEQNPDLWKKFFPHPSFVSLLKAVVDVLKRKQKLSIWVDGAYGTGKSHAVFTLKKLLEASDAETKEYFQEYSLDSFLCSELTTQKNEGKILVCHRYGSSDIESDTDLIVAIQEAVENALAEAGLDNGGNLSMKNALIRYLENAENKQSFNIYAQGSYKNVLGGDDADAIVQKLNQYQDAALRELIEKIFKIPAVKGAFSMNTGELCDWLREVITSNDLKELVFMWDEFSEYFENNLHHLTGFQQIAELSATAPFCLLIVTHKAEGYFSDNDPDKRKILDRFVPPVHIWLPENIAFELMGKAMLVTEDTQLAAKWAKNKGSLDRRTMQSSKAVKKTIGLSDDDLSNVLPIHPYAALILQHISIYYTSTARSMFNFIKNDEGEDVKAFQWFIDNYDFSSQNPFVTVDMLWSFFYESGRDKLATGIKEVLSAYTTRLEHDLIDAEKRVMKTILLLQAISDRMTGKRDIFLPNDKNLTLAFEGTDLEFTARNVAKKLLNDHVISRTPLTGDVFTYCCHNTGPEIDIAPFIPQAKAKTTKDMSFMTGSDLRSTVELTGALRLRYSLSYATSTDFDNEMKKAHNPATESNKLYVVATIARDAAEGAVIKKKIDSFYQANPDSRVVVIDSSDIVLGEDRYNEFVENYATALAIGQSDINMRKTYEGYAIEVLKEWAKRIRTGDAYVYSCFVRTGERTANLNDLSAKLMEINKMHYPSCLEGEFVNVLNTMYDANSLGAGATCGITEETKGTFRSGNEATKLENALKGAWRVPEYWKTTHGYVAALKLAVDKLIEDAFDTGDRISISEIYNALKAEPYGFMPCNLTAFILGFLLKEYADSTYSYCDDLTTVPLSADKLASMISEIIKNENTPDKRYKEKYIVTLTEEERAFNKITSAAFNIPEMYCVSITDTRSKIREQMKGFSFPIWVIEYVLDGKQFATSRDVVRSLLDEYCGIANNKNASGERSDNDIALSIGRISLDNPKAVDDLKSVLTKDNCKAGMLAYLEVYQGGKIPAIAKRIGDGGQYINHLAYKFNSDAANWVWNRDTVNEKIDELITEYEIIELSNRVLTKNITYNDTIYAWLDKISQIRLSYATIKNELGDSSDFYGLLCELKTTGSLLDSQKAKFLALLAANVEDFKLFMGQQEKLFMKVCAFYLDDLTEEDAKKILENDKYGFRNSYTLEPSAYTGKVQAAVKAYKSTLGQLKLKKLWMEMTGTESPFAWSEKYDMPVYIMVPDDEIAIARKALTAITSKSATDESIAIAMDYLSKITYLDRLNSSQARDRAFADVFLREYGELFDDIAWVKCYLRKHVVEAPFYWHGSRAVTATIQSMAKAKYNESGYDQAKRIIDDMPPEQVKEYLKQLIQDNVVVGVEIIKGKK